MDRQAVETLLTTIIEELEVIALQVEDREWVRDDIYDLIRTIEKEVG